MLLFTISMTPHSRRRTINTKSCDPMFPEISKEYFGHSEKTSVSSIAPVATWYTHVWSDIGFPAQMGIYVGSVGGFMHALLLPLHTFVP